MLKDIKYHKKKKVQPYKEINSAYKLLVVI